MLTAQQPPQQKQQRQNNAPMRAHKHWVRRPAAPLHWLRTPSQALKQLASQNTPPTHKRGTLPSNNRLGRRLQRHKTTRAKAGPQKPERAAEGVNACASTGSPSGGKHRKHEQSNRHERERTAGTACAHRLDRNLNGGPGRPQHHQGCRAPTTAQL